MSSKLIAIPKTELHIHIGGSWPLDYLESIGNQDDITNLLQFLDNVWKKNGTSYHSCFQAFALVNKIVNTEDKVENGCVALCNWLIEDGVTYVELRTSLKDLGKGYEAYLISVLKGLERGSFNKTLKVSVLLSLRRNCSPELANETLNLILKYNNSSSTSPYTVKVVGLDVSDNAMLGNGSEIFRIGDILHTHQIPIVLHLGV